jgi:hypothetical protein
MHRVWLTVRLLLLVRHLTHSGHRLPDIAPRTTTTCLGLSSLSLHQPQLHLHRRAHRIREHLPWVGQVLGLPWVLLLLVLLLLLELLRVMHLHG